MKSLQALLKLPSLSQRFMILLQVLILIGALLSVAIFQNNDPTTLPIYVSRVSQEYMQNLHVTHFNAAGHIKDEIFAHSWAYLPKFANSILEQPKMLLNKTNGAVWIITAKTATAWHPTLNSKISKLDLNQDVNIQRVASAQFVPIQMKSSQLCYFPKTDTVTSKAYVELAKPGFKLTGTGLKGNLQQDTMQLLTNVTTHYETNS